MSSDNSSNGQQQSGSVTPVMWVRIDLPEVDHDNGLLCYADFGLDGNFTVRGCRVLRTESGRLRVAMPARAHRVPCDMCQRRIDWNHRYCHCCGARQSLRGELPVRMQQGGVEFWADVCHPSNAAQRREIESAILVAYRRRLEEERSRAADVDASVS